MNPKVERDPYLAAVAERWGQEAAYEAGFFDDEDPDDAPLDDVGWLCTPTEQVRRALTDRPPTFAASPPIVLLSTGGFFPLHDGHLMMMERARAKAEAEGWWVVGGYLSPGHDDYLRLKWGDIAPPAAARLAALTGTLGTSDWLSVDPWEALHRRVAVNYTDVTARLERYLRHHLDPTIEVAFVCGGDNARFALAFALRGRCIVVDRPGCDTTVDRWRSDERIATSDRILWATSHHAGASRFLRPAPWRDRPHELTLRIEDTRSVKTLGLDAVRWRRFQNGLRDELGGLTDLTTVDLTDQAPGPIDGTISLDPLLPGEANLGVSRLFELGGYRALGHVARPGWPPLTDQVAAIRTGPWILRDDDRWSGGTLDFIRDRLPPSIEITGTVITLDGSLRADADIADSRDFLLGADDGGLVVLLPDGTTGRAPYLLPYVDPSARGSVPARHALAFSARLWALNAEVFAGSGLEVTDVPAPTAATLTRAGHRRDELLEHVCRDYADALLHLATHPNMSANATENRARS